MKRTITIVLILACAAGLIVWGVVASRSKPPAATVKAVKGDIAKNVLVTGTTKPIQSVDLSFERIGKVSWVYVQVGDKVKAGQSLVEMEKGDVLAQLAQAQAALASQQAQLDALKSGTRPEQIAVQEVTVANAQVAQAQARNALLDALTDAYAKADDAMHVKTDGNFTNPHAPVPTLNFSTFDAQHINTLTALKPSIELSLDAWKAKFIGLTVDSDLSAAAADADMRLDGVKDFLDELVAALNDAIPGSSASITAWKTDAAAARTAVGAAISSLSAAETALKSAESSLALAQKNMALAKAGSTPEQIAAQQAAVNQAKANVQSVEVSLSKAVLRSPIDGVVTVQGAKLGQIVSGTSSLVSIISPGKMEVDANIPEVDIGRLKFGQKAEIVFDALPGETFNGSVMEIDPAETVIDGVVNYKIKIALDSDDPRIKSGLTANLAILTEIKKGVILLPQNAILQNETGTFVRVPDGKNGFKDVPVKLGIRGNDGNVEVISGVDEGDTVANVGLK